MLMSCDILTAVFVRVSVLVPGARTFERVMEPAFFFAKRGLQRLMAGCSVMGNSSASRAYLISYSQFVMAHVDCECTHDAT